jgi:drug/metabolite transporter (DMT)-like permease
VRITIVRELRTQTILLAALAMVAFAANSVLCRVALRGGAIDPASFSTIRIVSGAVTLFLICAWKSRAVVPMNGALGSASLLILYAVPFSFAYVSLSAGTGALILFGCVQSTMLLVALRRGESVLAVQWIGLGVALAGLIVLVLPSLTTPALFPAALMALAGISWGLYSWRGRSGSALAATAANFVQAVPLVLLVSLAALSRAHVSSRGVVLSVASGAVASGLGYVAWYAALSGLTGMQAAVVQLAAPVLAAAGGVIFLAEMISIRLVFSAIMVLGGIALTIVGRERRSQRIETTAV